MVWNANERIVLLKIELYYPGFMYSSFRFATIRFALSFLFILPSFQLISFYSFMTHFSLWFMDSIHICGVAHSIAYIQLHWNCSRLLGQVIKTDYIFTIVFLLRKVFMAFCWRLQDFIWEECGCTLYIFLWEGRW